MASKKAASWRRGWFSGLLPDGLRAPRTGQDGHKCHEENEKQGGEKVGIFSLALSNGCVTFYGIRSEC